MESRLIIFGLYSIFGFTMILFNFKISNFFNNLVLYFTNKLKIEELFLFKIDDANYDSMFILMKYFTIFFGLFIILFSVYMIY